MEHMIENFLMPHAVSASCLWHQVGRIAHRLHAAADNNITAARSEEVKTQHGRFHARSTDLVDGRAGCAHWNAGGQCRLSGRSLPQPGRQDAAEQHFVDTGGVDTAISYSGARRCRGQVGCAHGAEFTQECTQRRAAGGDDVDGFVAHGNNGFRLQLQLIAKGRYFGVSAGASQ